VGSTLEQNNQSEALTQRKQPIRDVGTKPTANQKEREGERARSKKTQGDPRLNCDITEAEK
jgi:hypothetical protein